MKHMVFLLMASGGHTAPVSGGHGEGNAFPPFDASTFPSQLFWLFVSFGLLLFLLARVLLPRVGRILEERSHRIADDLDTAAQMQREAELAGKAYEKALADARAKAHNVAETTRAGVQTELEAEMARAEADIAKQMEKAEAAIRATREKALANVETIATDTAGTILEHVFGKKIPASKTGHIIKSISQEI